MFNGVENVRVLSIRDDISRDSHRAISCVIMIKIKVISRFCHLCSGFYRYELLSLYPNSVRDGIRKYVTSVFLQRHNLLAKSTSYYYILLCVIFELQYAELSVYSIAFYMTDIFVLINDQWSYNLSCVISFSSS